MCKYILIESRLIRNHIHNVSQHSFPTLSYIISLYYSMEKANMSDIYGNKLWRDYLNTSMQCTVYEDTTLKLTIEI